MITGDSSTSFPGFSPTLPYGARERERETLVGTDRFHRSVTLRAENSFYIYGKNNILALMTLRKAVVWNVSFLQPLTLFYDAATEKTYRF